MTEVRLSRALLRAFVLRLQGWRFVERRVTCTSPFRESHVVYAWAPSEVEFMDGRDKTDVIESYIGTLQWQSNQPDPSREIGAAWAFAREMMQEGIALSFFRHHDGQYSLCGGAGQGLVVRPQESEALCLCLAYYEFKTGARAVLVGDDE